MPEAELAMDGSAAIAAVEKDSTVKSSKEESSSEVPVGESTEGKDVPNGDAQSHENGSSDGVEVVEDEDDAEDPLQIDDTNEAEEDPLTVAENDGVGANGEEGVTAVEIVDGEVTVKIITDDGNKVDEVVIIDAPDVEEPVPEGPEDTASAGDVEKVEGTEDNADGIVDEEKSSESNSPIVEENGQSGAAGNDSGNASSAEEMEVDEPAPLTIDEPPEEGDKSGDSEASSSGDKTDDVEVTKASEEVPEQVTVAEKTPSPDKEVEKPPEIAPKLVEEKVTEKPEAMVVDEPPARTIVAPEVTIEGPRSKTEKPAPVVAKVDVEAVEITKIVTESTPTTKARSPVREPDAKDDDDVVLVVDEDQDECQISVKSISAVPKAAQRSGEPSPAAPGADGKASPTPDVKIVEICAPESPATQSGTKRPISAVSSPPASSSSGSKRAKADEPPERLPDVKDMEVLEKMLQTVRKDIRALDVQMKEKEREWNLLVHKKKRMEEYYLRLRRKKEVNQIETTGILPPVPTATTAGPSTSSTSTSTTTAQTSQTVGAQVVAEVNRSKTSSPLIASLSATSVSSPSPLVSHTVHHIAATSVPQQQQQTISMQQRGQLGAQINVHQLLTQQQQQQLQLLQQQQSNIVSTPLVPSSSAGGVSSVTAKLLKATDRAGSNLPRAMTINTDMLYGPKSKVSVDTLIAQHRAKTPTAQQSNASVGGMTLAGANQSVLRRWQQQHQQQQQNHGGMKAPSDVEILMDSTKQQQESLLAAQQQQQSSSAAAMYNDLLVAAARGARPPPPYPQKSGAVNQAAAAAAAAAASSSSHLQHTLTLGPHAVAAAVAAARNSNSVGITSRQHAEQAAANLSLSSLLDNSRNKEQAAPRHAKTSSNTGGSTTIERTKPKETKQQEGHPTCHGCKQRMAQFVCAGCNSQWYCSRECQIKDWDEHAEECSG